MSRKLFLVVTALFWMAVGAAWLDSRSGPATPVVPPAEVGKRFALAEVARSVRDAIREQKAQSREIAEVRAGLAKLQTIRV